MALPNGLPVNRPEGTTGGVPVAARCGAPGRRRAGPATSPGRPRAPAPGLGDRPRERAGAAEIHRAAGTARNPVDTDRRAVDGGLVTEMRGPARRLQGSWAMATADCFPIGAGRRAGPRPADAGAAARRGHTGQWRAVAALPTIAGSLFLLLVLFGVLGAGEPAVPAWLAGAVVVSTRQGERWAVRAMLRFRRPDPVRAAAIGAVWERALAAAGCRPAQVELYLRRGAAVNAYAVGRRSVAVSTGAVDAVQAGWLGEEHLTAVVVHELGHHATGGTRFSLAVLWLVGPWRAALRLLGGSPPAVAGRRRPRRLLAGVVVLALSSAVGQAVRHDQWPAALVLVALAGCGAGCPLADAAAARRSEVAADRFAAACGMGAHLAAALEKLTAVSDDPPRGVARLLDPHPPLRHRIDALRADPQAAPGPPPAATGGSPGVSVGGARRGAPQPAGRTRGDPAASSAAAAIRPLTAATTGARAPVNPTAAPATPPAVTTAPRTKYRGR